MKIKTIGIDLAKDVFQLHGVDEFGNMVLRKQVKRAQLAIFISNLPVSLVGMEACSGAHYWARKLLKIDARFFKSWLRRIAPDTHMDQAFGFDAFASALTATPSQKNIGTAMCPMGLSHFNGCQQVGSNLNMDHMAGDPRLLQTGGED